MTGPRDVLSPAEPNDSGIGNRSLRPLLFAGPLPLLTFYFMTFYFGSQSRQPAATPGGELLSSPEGSATSSAGCRRKNKNPALGRALTAVYHPFRIYSSGANSRMNDSAKRR